MLENQEKLLEIARSLIGTPYKYAAKPEDIPKYLDCSSFTQYVYQQIGIGIPRSTLLQAAKAGKEISLKAKSPARNASRSDAGGSKLKANLEAGDLLFFRGSKGHYDDELFPDKEIYIGHVAMYSENGKVIHGAYKRGLVEEAALEEIIKEKGSVALAKRIL